MKRTPILAALAVGVASCGSAAAPTSPTTAPTSSTAPTTAQEAATTAPQAAPDPYDAFQAAAKAQGIAVPADLDRDSALVRALLGCGTTWPPKTLDALLAQAYDTQIRQAKAQGHCQ